MYMYYDYHLAHPYLESSLIMLGHITYFFEQVILFDLASGYSRLSGWRKELWELSHVGIPDHDQESKDAIVFGYLTYWFISQVHSSVCNARCSQCVTIHHNDACHMCCMCEHLLLLQLYQ